MTRLKTFATIEVGSRAKHVRRITARDVELYAELTGDHNPVHVDEEYAAGTRFGHRVAHGLLTCGLVQQSLTELVAPGGVSLAYEFHLKKPVFLEDTITAWAEVTEKLAERSLVRCPIECVNQRGQTVVAGEALIKMLQ